MAEKLSAMTWWKSRVLTGSGLSLIRDHKYKGGDYTPLDNAMNPFWFACANVMPMWLAPNLITLTALICTSVGHITLAYYDPNYDTSAPRWVYFFVAVMMFFYQTLDAMDGKQARRTNNSTPLGQLFDHGCDACTVLWCADGMSSLTKTPERALWNQAMFAFPFFLAQWEEMHTGTLRTCMLFNEGKFGVGVTETQILQMSLFLMAGLFGPEIYSTPLFGAMTFGYLLYYAFHLMVVTVVTMNTKLVWDTKASTPRRQEAFLNIVSPVAITLMALTWPEDSLLSEPRVISICYSISMILCICKMIVFSMAHMEYKAFQPVALCVALPYVLAQLGIAPTFVYYLALLASLILFGRFVTGAISEICEHLNIKCFRIKAKSDGPTLAIPDKKEENTKVQSPTGTNC